MEDGMANGRRLEVIQGALLGRIRDLETRKRLPRGYSVKDLRSEIAILEDEVAVLGRQRAALLRAVDVGPKLDATVGVG